MIVQPRCVLLLLPLLCLVSCKQPKETSSDEDPYMVRMDFLERKIAELRDTTERRLQDEKTRRENQLAVMEKSLRDLESRLAGLQSRVEQLGATVTDLEDRLAKAPASPPDTPRAVVPPMPPTPAAPPLPKPPEDSFPIEVSALTPVVVAVRTQASVRVIETGKITRDETGRRVPEVKTETYPIYEYEYRLRFSASNRTPQVVAFQAEAGYGPTGFSLPVGGVLTNGEIRWRAGASLIIRANNQHKIFSAPPPPPPSP